MSFATFVLVFAAVTGLVCFASKSVWAKYIVLTLAGYFALVMVAGTFLFSFTSGLTESGWVCKNRICAEESPSCFSVLGGTLFYEPDHPALQGNGREVDISIFSPSRAGVYALPDGSEVFWAMFLSAMLPIVTGLIAGILREELENRLHGYRVLSVCAAG